MPNLFGESHYQPPLVFRNQNDFTDLTNLDAKVEKSYLYLLTKGTVLFDNKFAPQGHFLRSFLHLFCVLFLRRVESQRVASRIHWEVEEGQEKPASATPIVPSLIVGKPTKMADPKLAPRQHNLLTALKSRSTRTGFVVTTPS